MVYIDIAITIYINNIAFRTLPATRLLFESQVGSGANVGGITPGMVKSSSLRARRSSRIKKICYDAKDMKKRRKQKNCTLGGLPAPAARSGCAQAGFRLARPGPASAWPAGPPGSPGPCPTGPLPGQLPAPPLLHRSAGSASGRLVPSIDPAAPCHACERAHPAALRTCMAGSSSPTSTYSIQGQEQVKPCTSQLLNHTKIGSTGIRRHGKEHRDPLPSSDKTGGQHRASQRTSYR
jgi:hypothetical protein